MLQLLTGIAAGYEPAQTQIAAHSGVLVSVHVLEDMSSEQQMGSLAENLLAAVRETRQTDNQTGRQTDR